MRTWFAPKDGGKMTLRFILVVPFMLQIFAAVGLTAYLSLRNGRESTEALITRLQDEVTDRAAAYVRDRTDAPHEFLQSTAAVAQAQGLDLNNSAMMERYFWQRGAQLESAQLLYLGRQDGSFIGVERSPKASTQPDLRWQRDATTNWDLESRAIANPGAVGTLQDQVSDFDPRDRPWYQTAVAARAAAWSPVYWDVPRPILVISAVLPIYADRQPNDRQSNNPQPDNRQSNNPQSNNPQPDNRQPVTVLSVDFNLTAVSQFLQELQVSPTGAVFIVERTGDLVASSDTELPFRQVGDRQLRLAARDSANPAIRMAADYLAQHYPSLAAISTENQAIVGPKRDRTFVQVRPIQDGRGLDWLLVVSMPEADFTEDIKANTRNALLLCFGALIAAVGVGLLTTRAIVRPILRLNAAAQELANGRLDLNIHENVGIAELEVLAASFNQMARRLKDAFEELEIRVQLRTFELWEAKEAADTAKEAATAASRAKSEFLANMSHELRTPLNGILGYAQILERDRTLNDKQRRSIEVIHHCGTHLLTLIEDVLDLSKIEARRMELHLAPTDFASFLRSVVEICRVRAEQKQIGFDFATEGTMPPAVMIDSKRLRQVLINLIGNAIKFTDRGQVTLTVTLLARAIDPPTAQLRFRIQDTGIGMSAAHVTQIFQPFEQLGSVDRKAQGTGLGLAISQRIVQLMGSEIQVTSQPGQGSEFWFDVTVTEASSEGQLLIADVHHAPPAQDIVGYQGPTRRILIADDRAQNRQVLTDILQPLGFDLVTVEHGQQAWDYLQGLPTTETVDLAIVDLQMPIMGGLQLIERLRDTPRWQSLPLVVSSARVFQHDRDRSLAAGANDFLAKPITATDLLDCLQQQLNLDWQESDRAVSPTPDQTAPADVTQNPSLPPPLPEIQSLYELAMRGNLNKIRDRATDLKAEYPDAATFLDHLLGLARRFQVRQIRDFLQPYCNAADPASPESAPQSDPSLIGKSDPQSDSQPDSQSNLPSDTQSDTQSNAPSDTQSNAPSDTQSDAPSDTQSDAQFDSQLDRNLGDNLGETLVKPLDLPGNSTQMGQLLQIDPPYLEDSVPTEDVTVAGVGVGQSRTNSVELDSFQTSQPCSQFVEIDPSDAGQPQCQPTTLNAKSARSASPDTLKQSDGQLGAADGRDHDILGKDVLDRDALKGVVLDQDALDGDVLDQDILETLLPEHPSTGANTIGSGTTKSGTTKSGTTESGATESGATESGATESGTTESGATDSSATESGKIDRPQSDFPSVSNP